MSQQINLNVAPYFDDFDKNNEYHKVLFKPGYPVQARELTTLQSILQNKIEKFGQHFFKEGAKVIPGNTSYTQLYYCVQLQNIFLGVPVEAYVDQLIGSKITGQTSGVTAVVDNIIFSQDSERGNLTLYINYLSSNTENNSTQEFSDGESLVTNVTISSNLLGNTSIAAGQPFAVTIANNSTATGSSFSIGEGIYFIRGQFVDVNTETLILDQYTNVPNYRIGLFVNEQIITSDIDEKLNDNSQGFNNYSAPGADRLRITTSLFKKSLNDYSDNNFVELATVNNGILQDLVQNTQYNIVLDELARRTYDESGDYVVKPFSVSIKDSLNNNKGNSGIFNFGQFTNSGLTPSDNLAVYQVSPGKAFIRGYGIETISSLFLDVEKPRTVKTLENQSINYNTGSTLSLNNVLGTPIIGIGNTYVLSLRDERVGTSNAIAPGKEIGVARVYDFRLESGSYNTSIKLNEWNISLYDVQTFTEITLNEPITLLVPTFVEGANSGAHGFIRSTVSAGTALTVYDIQGTFLRNESFIFDGIANGRVATAVTSYGLSDVKSVYSLVGSASTFSADSVQSTKSNIGIALISPVSSGISTITSPNVLFPGNLIKNNNLISYSDTTLADPVFARVVSVGSTAITITGVTTVTGVSQGKLPTAALNVTDLRVLTNASVSSDDNTLYTLLPKSNISSVDLINANLVIRKSFTVNIASNELSIPVSAGTNETFLPFDEERYSLIRSDGSTELLTSDRFDFIAGGTQLQIYNLGSNDTGSTLITTLRKIKPKAKVKRKNRVSSIVVDKSETIGSGIGGTTLNDGLEFGNYAFGTRVQDKNISLNVPDIIEIHGIFESVDTANPSAPKMVLSSISGPTNTTSDLIIGEEILVQNESVIAIVAEKLSSSQIVFISKNNENFREGQTVFFRESNIQAVITTLDSPSFNISSNYTFAIGQKKSFYDYGFITRKLNADKPNKKIKIYFSNGFYDSSDDGDITTVDSYNTFDYGLDIKTFNGTPNSDIIDIRPRVSSYSVLENSRSPFEFFGRTFNASGNSAANILASDESLLVNYSFYLGRIDSIYITKNGKFQVKYGSPSENPEKPVSVDDALELASINLPPYLYSTSDAIIQFLDHKRYRMVDIRQLEDRIKNLEYYTTLSLLETSTANLFIEDSSGLNKFKSGFFVDNFTSIKTQEDSVEIKNSIDISNKELRPKHYTNSIDLIFGPVQNINPATDLQFSSVQGINIIKTGDIITLDYAEVQWIGQVFGTRSESVTPFLVNFWKGTIELTPASDTWIDNVRIESRVIDVEGNSTELVQVQGSQDQQTGFSPTVWNSWVDNWTGQTTTSSIITRNIQNTTKVSGGTIITDSVIQDNLQEIKSTGTSTRTGTRTLVTKQTNRTSIGDRVVSRDLISFMRSRNIQFVAKKLKPLTEVYAFFDGVDVTKYCIPKLLEITTISGVFQVGETVVGTLTQTGLGPTVIGDGTTRISFRVAQSNHKEGRYNLPTKVFTRNPYTNQVLPATYSSTTNILNIDTFSLSNEPQGLFFGLVQRGMTLVGRTSGAQATVSNIRLISDFSATLIGSFFIPNSNSTIHPRFETGTKNLILINNRLNNVSLSTTFAEEKFLSTGTIETVQDTIVSVRTARIETRSDSEDRSITKTTGTQLVGSNVVSQTSRFIPDPTPPEPPKPPEPPLKPYTTSVVHVTTTGAGGERITVSLDISSTVLVSTVSPGAVGTYIVTFNQPVTGVSGGCGSMGAGGNPQPTLRLSGSKKISSTKHQFDFETVDGPNFVRNLSVTATPTIPISNTSSSAAVPTGIKSGVCIYKDPLAQSFSVSDSSGVFITRCDLFFQTVDDTDIPVTIQIRPMQQGYPTEIVLPFSEVVLNPDEIQVSSNGSVSTVIRFKSPVYLEGGKEYCIVLLSNSTKYNVYISRVGENDLITQEFVSTQPYLGSLFKSQNSSTWEPSQWEDLKFTLYRADFVGSGTVEVYSSELSEGNNQIAKLMTNSLNFNSKRVRISLASTISDPNFIIGNTVLQSGTNASGNYVGNAGIATGSLNIINAGIGYTPSSGIATFFGVILQTITGKGRDALAKITVSNGVAIGATITSGGSGYQIGDVLGISSIGAVNVGTNARLSLSNISNINQIIVDNVQGDFTTGVGKTIQYEGVGVGTTGLNGTGVLVDEIITETDGLHIKIDHRNHGMYFNDNLVTIFDAQSDIKPTKLSIQLAADSTGSISVDTTSAFSTFENVGVGTTNPGYLLIGDEIIEYTSASGGVIGGNIVRGTNPTTHPIGEPVYKYELNGVSLRRINKTHNLNDVTVADPITFDSYNIKLDMSSAGVGVGRSVGNSFPSLYANQTKSTGGYNVRATQNMPFEIITPNIHNLTVQGTSLSAEARTITGSSVSGNEIPFTDIGFEPITINAPNYLDSTRIIASKVNENNKLSNLPGNKSMNMRLTLGTTNSKVSPVIDTQRISAILTSNRVNSVIENYATDARVDTIADDPSAFQYISKEIALENPASSIKIIIDAHINLYSDIRVFYAISENQNFDPIFTPFPGYKNLDQRGQIIDFEDSDGHSDKFISQSSTTGFISQELDYKEYTFTADQLPSFRSYRIKLVMTSTNQVYVPRAKNLRVIALA